MSEDNDPDRRHSHNAGRTSSCRWIRTSPNGVLIPLLVIRDRSGEPRCHWQFLDYAWDAVSRGVSGQELARAARVVGLMSDYHARMLGHPVSTEHDLDAFLGRFLHARYRGTIGQDGTDPSGLLWHPVKWTTMEADRRAARAFLRFCCEHHGFYPPLQEIAVPAPRRSPAGMILARLQQSSRDFFFHLADRRHSPQGSAVVPLPGLRRVRTGSRPNAMPTAFPMDRFEELVARTANPVHRMCWILGAFGGLRISEQLNMWVEDVLPGRYAPNLFPGQPAIPTCLVILAHPSESRYTGELRDFGSSRSQALSRKGLVPRNVQHERHRLYAGWKYPLLENQTLMVGQVYWSDPRWAAVYWELYREVMELRQRLPSSCDHPWLLTNLDRRGDHWGMPLKMGAVSKAFAAACQRIGLKPFHAGTSIHKLRHAYKQQLARSGFSAADIQMMMHHNSIESQNSYGKSPIDIHNAIVKQNIARYSNNGTKHV